MDLGLYRHQRAVLVNLVPRDSYFVLQGMEPMTEPSLLVSADELLARAQRALESSPVFGLRSLQVQCGDEALVITGRVASFYHKQLAQEIVLAIAGSTIVLNQVRVEPSGDDSGYPVRQPSVRN